MMIVTIIRKLILVTLTLHWTHLQKQNIHNNIHPVSLPLTCQHQRVELFSKPRLLIGSWNLGLCFSANYNSDIF